MSFARPKDALTRQERDRALLYMKGWVDGAAEGGLDPESDDERFVVVASAALTRFVEAMRERESTRGPFR